ncbi:DUF4298 domain-containing protein [Streptococcus pyogenes]|uniref:DUF4298 domain-containing protein n=1 Tax=Streptococcus pyogenes TaxID=1314 RepID=UPI0010A14299|nr:DUF4298 domain-containing protein [Streptococcus pyogenes]QHB63933.1 DUF4298 domain-containing protein [Streptococcus pyogenes]QIK42933.1 DUF4298 domain-containing protein [Streptococcus pyogenes]QIK45213.1 DUF4298 domain-containing protein [Streptococcus pyogenes]WCE84010.1 DUF4298 domain-containing protein [Streptococcus pyogenes]WER79920.1 DUF4298 domain-containing protein [Streptococcus pyogenes]
MTKQDQLIVEKMEQTYEAFRSKLANLIEALDAFKEHYEEYATLRNFYSSDEWFRLANQPWDDIPCGVLSEDLLFDMIGDHNQLLADILDLAPIMYKHM